MIEFIVIYILGIVGSVVGFSLYARAHPNTTFTAGDAFLCAIWPVTWVGAVLVFFLSVVYGAGIALSRGRTND